MDGNGRKGRELPAMDNGMDNKAKREDHREDQRHKASIKEGTSEGIPSTLPSAKTGGTEEKKPEREEILHANDNSREERERLTT